VQGNLWGESIQNETHAHYMLFPRLQAIAEVGWTPADNRNWPDFVNRLEHDMLWMDKKSIGYARSMYNVAIRIQPLTSGLGITLSTEHGSLPIHFTTDGTDPSANSNRYSKPINVTRSMVLKTAAFRNGKLLGKVKTKEVIIHKGMGKKVALTNSPSEKYPGIRNQSLTDLLRGSLEITHSQWMGFEAQDFEAVVDLEREKEIEKVILCCLEHQGKWIFLPSFVEVLTSVDGKIYNSVKKIGLENTINENEPRLTELEIPFEKSKVRYLKIRAQTLKECPDWHRGAGGKPWFFVDEIIVD
jgi:hexosaminidase